MPKFKKFGDLPVQTLMGHVGEDTIQIQTTPHFITKSKVIPPKLSLVGALRPKIGLIW